MLKPRVIYIDTLAEARKELEKVGVEGGGINLMAPKAVHRVLKINGVPAAVANILKQEMLSKGGEAAVARGVVNCAVEKSDVLLMGTLKQYEQLVAKLQMQPFGLAELAEEIKTVLRRLESPQVRTLKCGPYSFTLGERTLVMGILNITPDSFSDGGRFFDPEMAVAHARKMVEDGVDIIDVGGESTRPGHIPVPVEEELRRIIPVIERLAAEVRVPISVDTSKAAVAERAVAAGAHIINDVWGLKADPQMAKVVAEHEVPVVVMHNSKTTEYRDLIGEMIAFLQESMKLAEKAGVDLDKVIIDPGIGFGKTIDQNFEVMRRLREFKNLGQPVLLGTSRKSMIGKTLNLPVHERVEGTAATVTMGIMQGVDIVRVHDVKEMVRVVRMTDAMVRQ